MREQTKKKEWIILDESKYLIRSIIIPSVFIIYSVYSHRFYLLFSFFFLVEFITTVSFQNALLALALFCARKCII